MPSFLPKSRCRQRHAWARLFLLASYFYGATGAAGGGARVVLMTANTSTYRQDLGAENWTQLQSSAWEFHPCAPTPAPAVLERVEVVISTVSGPCNSPPLWWAVAEAIGNRSGAPPLMQFMMTGLSKGLVSKVPGVFAVANMHSSDISLAEWTLGAMLAHSTQQARIDEEFRACTWRVGAPGNSGRCPTMADAHGSLFGKELCILGFGHIGGEVAKRAHSFNMVIRGTSLVASEDPPSPLSWLGGSSREHAEQCVKGADFIVITLPLTPQTRGLVEASMLQLMKPGAFLVNIARGAIVDETSLFEALRDGSGSRIGGAALDVWWQGVDMLGHTTNRTFRGLPWAELHATGPTAWPSKLPFNEISPFKLITSPHVASRSEHDRMARLQEVTRQLDRLEHNLPPANIIRPSSVGYWPVRDHGDAHTPWTRYRPSRTVLSVVTILAVSAVSFFLGTCYERRKWKKGTASQKGSGYTDDERRRLVDGSE
jgi:phosphoglycerate dehydrogenase-like enzyme